MNLRIYGNALLLLTSLTTSTLALAKGKHPAAGAVPGAAPETGIDLIENKGQWNPAARFQATLPGGALFLTDKGFVYNYVNTDELEQIHELSDKGMDVSTQTVHHHAYKVNFVGAGNGVHYQSSGKKSHYNNYFIGNDRSKWASNVGLYGKVLEQNIYNGIDLAVYSKGSSLKYDFIVAPGANPAQIRLSFEGVQPELTAEGDLRIKTSVNEIREKAPYTYQMVNGVEKAVASRYVLKNNQLTFEFPNGFDASLPLIIDPTLVFCTYSGGVSSGSGFYSFSTTYDDQGNAYAGSQAYNAGWPTTTGAYQSTFAGGQDVAVNKYNATGTNLIYSTYFGGTNVDLPHTMKVNSLGELVVAGSTTSSNLPHSIGCLDSVLSGGTDIFVAHFNATGTAILGATYVGGSNAEPNAYSSNGVGFLTNQNTTSPVEINFDNNNNIWVVSNSSSADFPVSANAQQAVQAGGGDGVLFKLNPACSQLLYSSFLGGTSADALFGIQFNNAGNLVVCGGTQSTNYPTTTGAMITTAPGGSFDGVVTIINPSTGAILNSTYVGTSGADQALNVQIDLADNVYVMGRTDGTYPVSTGVYSIAGGNTYIDKLNPTLSASLLSTRVGSSNYYPDGFLLDMCGNVYVTGLSAAGGMPTTANAFQSTQAPFWFCVLKPNFSDLLYGSYFGIGSDHTHVGVSRLDPQGVVYHSICNAQQYPFTAPGVWDPTYSGGGQDIVTFKFDFEATGVNSVIALAPLQNDSVCAPFTINFQNNSTSPYSIVYTWDFGDNTGTSNATSPSHTFTNPGTYDVILHAHSDSACIQDDYDTLTITVLHTELPLISVHDTTLCTFEQSINIGVNIANPSINNTITWQPSTGILSPADQAEITVDPSANNVYWVTVKDTIPGICGFSSTDTVHIDLSPRVLDIINNDTVVCEGAAVPINAVGTPGYTYKWSPTVGVSDSTALEPVITIHQPNLYTLTASYPNCPDTSVTINFDMHYIPTLDLGPDKSVCQWTEVALESSVTPFRNDYIYQWTPATPNLSDPTGPNTHFIADTTITYELHVQTPIGCADRDSITILVYPGGFGGITADTGYCPGGSAQLQATGGTVYSWSPSYGLSDTTVANPVASPLTTTDYTVLIKDIHDCLDTEKVNVQVYSQAVINIPDSVTVYPGEQYHVEPNTNCLYFSWFPPSGLSADNIADPLMSPQVRTRYFVNAVTEHGCTVTDSMDVLVHETVLDMPNAFAPSGANHLFKPSKRGIAQLKEFSIYNRWGNKVYSSTNIDEGWDGTKDGKALPMGVYIYVIEAVTDSGQAFSRQGNVTLIR